MLTVKRRLRGGLARKYAIKKGDTILAFDGNEAVDILDYVFFDSKPSFTLTVSRKGKTREIAVEKGEDQSLGLLFDGDGLELKTCHNKCTFCFVDQMPKGMRESLYVKDDDYGMSFSCGNFVTLTNLTDEGLERIIRLKLSPLYVSVHTMNQELRCKLLRNRFAGKIVEQIDRLCKNGIEIHCQAVLVPGENDGEELAYTARELFKYYPSVRDLACVPTGITKFRDGLYPIADVDKAYSEKLLDLVDKLNEEFGVDFLLPADEYFVKAGRPFKSTAFYGDFEQIENGIGMTAKFLQEAKDALASLQSKTRLKKQKKSLVISGVSAKKVNDELLKKCNEEIEFLQAETLAIANEFFGHTVTCTGLLTGQDIVAAVKKYEAEQGGFDEIVLPGNTMKEFEDVFLCGMTLQEMKKQLGFSNIRVNRDGGYGLVEILSTLK